MPVTPTDAKSPKNWRLFKCWISLYPVSLGLEPPRLTLYKEVGRVAIDIYDQLKVHPAIKLPDPQGGAIDSTGSLVSGLNGALSFTPSIGKKAPYVYVSGHFYSERDTKNPFSFRPVFSGGVLYNIQSANPQLGNPKQEVLDDIKDLKGIIDTAVNTALSTSSTNYEIDKIDYLGLIFGLSGVHFPL